MSTTIKQKSKFEKMKKLGYAEMLSVLENVDIMLGNNHYERDDSEFEITARRLKALVMKDS